MTDLEKVRAWLQTYPGYGKLETLSIDYTPPAPNAGGLSPKGVQELSRKTDILGNLTVENRYSFSLYCVFEKAPGGDDQAAANAQWLMDLQDWVRQQSYLGLAPVFGDDPATERIRLENGRLYVADQEGVATYQADLTAEFKKYYE